MSDAPGGGRILRSSPWARLASALILIFVATAALLAVMVDLAAARTAREAAGRLGGDATVVVWSHGLESADAAAARASVVLAKVPGVTAAHWLDPAPSDALVAAAAGAPAAPRADVRLVSVAAPDAPKGLADQLAKALSSAGVPARAMAPPGLTSAVGAAPLLAAMALVPLAGLLAFAVVGWLEARREWARGHAVIELMWRSGAAKGFIAGEVRRRVSGLVFVAALWGSAGAMVAFALCVHLGGAALLGGLSRQDLVSPWPALILALWLAGLAGAALAERARLKAMA